MPDTIVESLAQWADFWQWLEIHDEHAAHHRGQLEDALQVLEGDADSAIGTRESLSENVERCRYQLLKKLAEQISATDQAMLDQLDMLAHRLAGRGQRLPRGPRVAIQQDTSAAVGEDLTEEEIERYLRSDDAAEELFRRATELTWRWFSCDQHTLPFQGSPVEQDSSTAQPLAESSSAPRKRTHTVPAGGRLGRPANRTMVLYTPLYLSSHCVNYCSYCGFRFGEDIERRHLTEQEALEQADILAARGFRHVLLVAGDFPKLTSTAYFANIIRALQHMGLEIAVEIAPLSTAGYAELVEAGACGVTLYQETYDSRRYADYHWRGTKAAYDWRLEAPERAAEAGMARLGLGVLLGLAEPTAELVALIRHGRYLQARFPHLQLSFGLPRIHEAPGDFTPPYVVDDALFVRLYAVLRLAFPRAHLVLSTRESVDLRSRLAQLCVTQMSAGSSTAPGGYEADQGELDGPDQADREQFPIADHRPVSEVDSWLEQHGFAVRWGFD